MRHISILSQSNRTQLTFQSNMPHAWTPGLIKNAFSGATPKLLTLTLILVPKCSLGEQAILTAECTPCPMNEFKKKADRKGCKPCPDGTGTLSTGSYSKREHCISK